MTTVIFFKDTQHTQGFSVSGHSGYGTEGEDIVCAALSSCTELVLNTLDSFGIFYETEIDPAKAYVSCRVSKSENNKNSYGTASTIIGSFEKTVRDIENEYQGYVKCIVTEV